MNLRKQVGEALWLLVLLSVYTPADWDGNSSVWVAGGNIISNAELADRLQVSPRILAEWRRRLRNAQLIDWLLKPGIGRVYVITATNRLFSEGQIPAARQAPAVNPPAEPRPVQPGGAKRSAASEALKYLN